MSAPGGPFERLAEARRAMQGGLSLLDGARAEDADVPAARERLSRALADTGDFAAARKEVPQGDLECFDDELEDLLRLNAVLTAAVRQDREALMQRLKATRESRRDLARQAAAPSEGAGGRCDVSG